MPEPKIKLLFVIGQFAQGGAERHLFEVCRALDKNRFHIEILTWKSAQRSEFYYSRLEELGITIHPKLPRGRYFGQKLPRLQKPLDALYYRRLQIELSGFFDRFDLINFIQIENYFVLQEFFPNNDRLITFLLSNRYQYNYDVYAGCLPNREYRFVLMDPSQKDELQGSHCQDAQNLHVPLALDFHDRQAILRPNAGSPTKIGLFGRLSSERPIEFFFYAFQALSKYFDATLHLYGGGNPQIYERTLELLRIRDKVVFEGHQNSIEATLKRDNLTLAWMNSNGPVLGYGSLEVASFAVPMIFWNTTSGSHEEVLSQTGGALHTFANIVDFIEYNRDVLTHPDKLEKLGQELRAYIYDRHDIRRHIATLEKYFEETVQSHKPLGSTLKRDS